MKNNKLAVLLGTLAVIFGLAVSGCDLSGGTVTVENKSSYTLTDVAIYEKDGSVGSLVSLKPGESRSKTFSDDTDFVVSFGCSFGISMIYVNDKTWSGSGSASVSGGETFTLTVTDRY